MNLDTIISIFFLPQVQIPVLCGFIFIIAGFVLFKFPPKKINGLYGYRTAQSMLSKNHWNFAQKFSARWMMILGALLFVTGIIGSFIPLSGTTGLIVGMFSLIAAAVVLIWKTERALTQKFRQ